MYLRSDLVISEVFSAYGEPGHVDIYDCRYGELCITHLIYNNIGMVLDLSTLQDIGDHQKLENKVEIHPDTRVGSIYFYQTRPDFYANPVGTNTSNIITHHSLK